MHATTRAFPDGFRWGSATSAYQIEGAVDRDGRGRSVWDEFCERPGAIADASSGAGACEHYDRWEADLDLMVALGLTSYRFSIAWPRVVPSGSGAVEQRGLDFYRRLVDGLLERGVEPMATLWHWDTPQALQDAGGWESRDTAGRFAEYAAVVGEALGDRVPTVLTLNEPKTLVHAGYLAGIHAPGVEDMARATVVMHHLHLGHGLATQALRAVAPGARVGPALNLSHVYPAVGAEDAPGAADGVRRKDCFENRAYLDPVLTGRYPDDVGEVMDARALEAVVRDGDLATVAQPVDLLGVNYYNPYFVDADARQTYPHPVALPATWLQVHAPGLRDLLLRLHRDYGAPLMSITENGRPTPGDSLDEQLHDADRLDYLRDHLGAVHEAVSAGARVEGYHAWSLLDNFEWAEGYTQRFGIVHVDYETQVRTPKQSALWYAGVAKGNALP